MKKAFLILTICLLWAAGANAQAADGKISIQNLSVTEQGDRVAVAFDATIEPKAATRNHTLVAAPVLTDGQYKVSMPAIIVHGKGTSTSQARREWVAGTTANYPNAVYAENGQTIRYSTTVTAQEWMDGAQFRLESVLGSCCNYNTVGNDLLAGGIDLKRMQPDPEPEPEPQRWAPVTTADHLSTAFTFVVPESEYDPNEPFKIYDDERENSLLVYYRVNKYDIEPGYMDNERTMHNLTTAIDMILNSTDSRVTRIVVAGFASPEGRLEVNDRLAFERAVSVKKHLIETTEARDGQVMVYNGSVDWRGLRSMVMKSSLPEKNEIVRIIDSQAAQADRLAQLQRLNDGSTYRYLLHEYFPYLRNGAFIKVYYENN